MGLPDYIVLTVGVVAATATIGYLTSTFFRKCPLDKDCNLFFHADEQQKCPKCGGEWLKYTKYDDPKDAPRVIKTVSIVCPRCMKEDVEELDPR